MKTIKTRGKENHFKFVGLGVDSGGLDIMCSSIAECSAEDMVENYGEMVVVHHKLTDGPGLYRVDFYLPHSWNDSQEGSAVILFHSDTAIIGDGCYSFNNDWHRFIKAGGTDCGLEENERVYTGGDGEFDLHVQFTKMRDVDYAIDDKPPTFGPPKKKKARKATIKASLHYEYKCPHCGCHTNYWPHNDKQAMKSIKKTIKAATGSSKAIDYKDFVECKSCDQDIDLNKFKLV